jgi:hypothetical protein
MRKQIRAIVGLLILICLALSAVVLYAQDKPARTYYESLNLSTPEDAVRTFTAAFAKEDFLTVHMVLASKAQQQWQASFNRFNLDQIVKPDYAKQAIKNIPSFDQWESIEASFLFDTIMLDAALHDALLIDLRGDVNLESTEPSTTSDGDEAVDVSTTVKGIDGKVVFRLVQSPSKRWRVLQVIIPGGGDSKLLWSVPSTSESK